jgi:hypothetical protein
MTMRSDFIRNAVVFMARRSHQQRHLSDAVPGRGQIRSVIALPLSLVGGAYRPGVGQSPVNTLSGDELPVLNTPCSACGTRPVAGRNSIEAGDFERCGAARGAGRPMLGFAIDNHASTYTMR